MTTTTHTFKLRIPRFHVVLPECRVLGLAYREALQGSAYRARSVQFSRPTLDALINRDEPPEPFVESPLVVHEAMAAIRQPLQVDSLSISNGHFTYGERLAVGADPAVLTIAAVSLSVEGIKHDLPQHACNMHDSEEAFVQGATILDSSTLTKEDLKTC